MKLLLFTYKMVSHYQIVKMLNIIFYNLPVSITSFFKRVLFITKNSLNKVFSFFKFFLPQISLVKCINTIMYLIVLLLLLTFFFVNLEVVGCFNEKIIPIMRRVSIGNHHCLTYRDIEVSKIIKKIYNLNKTNNINDCSFNLVRFLDLHNQSFSRKSAMSHYHLGINLINSCFDNIGLYLQLSTKPEPGFIELTQYSIINKNNIQYVSGEFRLIDHEQVNLDLNITNHEVSKY
jgi:hypothetical protein